MWYVYQNTWCLTYFMETLADTDHKIQRWKSYQIVVNKIFSSKFVKNLITKNNMQTKSCQKYFQFESLNRTTKINKYYLFFWSQRVGSEVKSAVKNTWSAVSKFFPKNYGHQKSSMTKRGSIFRWVI